MTPRVKEILRNYDGNPPGVLTNLARLIDEWAVRGIGALSHPPGGSGI